MNHYAGSTEQVQIPSMAHYTAAKDAYCSFPNYHEESIENTYKSLDESDLEHSKCTYTCDTTDEFKRSDYFADANDKSKPVQKEMSENPRLGILYFVLNTVVMSANLYAGKLLFDLNP